MNERFQSDFILQKKAGISVQYACLRRIKTINSKYLTSAISMRLHLILKRMN